VLGFIVASAVVTLVARGFDYPAYKKEVVPALVASSAGVRTWAFTFAFLSIGLTTRIREFASIGARPLVAFTIGVLVNVVLRVCVIDPGVQRVLEPSWPMSPPRPTRLPHLQALQACAGLSWRRRCRGCRV